MFAIKRNGSEIGAFNSLLTTLGVGAMLFTSGCKSQSKSEGAGRAEKGGSKQQFDLTNNSPVPDGQTLSEFLDEETKQLHTESRGTNFIRSYKEKYMTQEQYTANLIQRYAILRAAIDLDCKDLRRVTILGSEPLSMLTNLENDLRALGRPADSISKSDLLASTQKCIAYIENLSPEARLAVSHIFVGGAGNGGKYIGKGIQECLGANTPVSTFTGTPHEAVESFEVRFNNVASEHHQEIIDAEKALYRHLIQINQDQAFARK